MQQVHSLARFITETGKKKRKFSAWFAVKSTSKRVILCPFHIGRTSATVKQMGVALKFYRNDELEKFAREKRQ